MVARRTLSMSATERDNLVEIRDNHEKAYMRERAAAIIKVMNGQSAYEIAHSGLLKPRKPDTIYAWLDRYGEQGIEGLVIRSGRGRKPAFSPSVPHQRGRTRRYHPRRRA